MLLEQSVPGQFHVMKLAGPLYVNTTISAVSRNASSVLLHPPWLNLPFPALPTPPSESCSSGCPSSYLATLSPSCPASARRSSSSASSSTTRPSTWTTWRGPSLRPTFACHDLKSDLEKSPIRKIKTVYSKSEYHISGNVVVLHLSNSGRVTRPESIWVY